MAREDITIATKTYQTNCSLAVADEYLAVDAIHGATWEAETDDEARSKFLVAATRRLDLLDWGLDLDAETIPEIVAQATALLAAEIQLDPTKAAQNSSEDLTKRIKAGGVEKENFRSGGGVVPLQSKTVYLMVYPYLSAGAVIADPAGCVGGTSSQFSDGQGGFGLRDGFG